MPASVFLDQLFFRAQRIVNTGLKHIKSPNSSPGCELIARSAMQVALSILDTQLAMMTWKQAIDELRVLNIRDRLHEVRAVNKMNQ